MDRLKREANPPTGQLASPVPQYKDIVLNDWAEVKGEGGASYVKDKDVFAKLEQARELLDAISGKDFATQTTLSEVLQRLEAIEEQLETGDAKVQLKGREVEIVINTTTEIAQNNVVLRDGGFGTHVGNARGLNTSKYRILALFVHNGMDAQIRLYEYMAYFNDLSYNESPYPNRIIYPLDIAIPSGASQYITIVDIPQMDKDTYPHVRSIWRFDTRNKTDGDLRAIVMGVPW